MPFAIAVVVGDAARFVVGLPGLVRVRRAIQIGPAGELRAGRRGERESNDTERRHEQESSHGDLRVAVCGVRGQPTRNSSLRAHEVARVGPDPVTRIWRGKCEGCCGRVAAKGQLLRPDEDTLAARALVVDDERRAESLQVFDGQLEILELELAAVEVDRAARLSGAAARTESSP